MNPIAMRGGWLCTFLSAGALNPLMEREIAVHTLAHPTLSTKQLYSPFQTEVDFAKVGFGCDNQTLQWIEFRQQPNA
jgi:hypothetical protein